MKSGAVEHGELPPPHGHRAALDMHDGAGSMRIAPRLTSGVTGTALLEPGSWGTGAHTPDLPQSWGRADLTPCSLFRPGRATRLVALHSVKMTQGWATPTAPESSFSRLPLHLCAGAHALARAFTHLHTLIHTLALTLAHMLTHFGRFT